MAQDEMAFSLELKSPVGAPSVRWARKAINLITMEWAFSEQACREIELCFGEALQNALDHGSSGNESVIVSCRVSGDRINITIEDPGAGNGDLERLKAAFDKKEENLPCEDEERGRGIYLIRNLMDETRLECLQGGGVRIILIKNRS